MQKKHASSRQQSKQIAFESSAFRSQLGQVLAKFFIEVIQILSQSLTSKLQFYSIEATQIYY